MPKQRKKIPRRKGNRVIKAVVQDWDGWKTIRITYANGETGTTGFCMDTFSKYHHTYGRRADFEELAKKMVKQGTSHPEGL